MDIECPICLEVIDKLYVTTSCCSKHFHLSCLSKCSSCPMCRGNFNNVPQLIIQIENQEQSNRCSICPLMTTVFIMTVIITFSILGAVSHITS